MDNNTATLQDVARLAGVSVSTVSRILSAADGADIPFADSTQARVRSAAIRLGYRPSKLARGLVGSRTGMIGLVVPSLEDSFFPGITAALQKRLNQSGYSVFLVSTEQRSDIEQASIEDFLSWRVDGLVVSPAQNVPDARSFWELWRIGVPFVLMDRFFLDTPFHSVTTDDQTGGRIATEHLLSLGRRRIAWVGGLPTVSTSRLRHLGYLDALSESGIDPPADYALRCEPTISGGQNLVQRIMALKPRPDALFCSTDMVAIGVIDECLRLGIRVPDDLAVVGYADLDLSGFTRVPLTTVRQPRADIGRLAAELLIDRIARKHIAERQIVLPVELVLRESTVGTATFDPKGGSRPDSAPPNSVPAG